MDILIKGMDEIPEDGAVLVVKHDNGKAYIKHACTYGYSMELVKLPAVQPDRDVIDDCLCHIYKNISVHTATGGVIAIKHYMQVLYEEIYGEGEKPWWMN